MYKIYKFLLDDKIRLVNLFGAKGLGKISLCKELARYVTTRNVFNEGVMYFNFAKLNTEQESDNFFRNTLNQNMNEASILLIFANIDNIEKRVRSFMWDIDNLLKRSKNIKIIVTKSEKWTTK